MYEGTNGSTPWPTLGSVRHLNFNHSGEHVAVSHYGFSCISNDKGHRALVNMLIGHLYILLKYLLIFKIQTCLFLPLSYMSSLYLSGMNPFSVLCIGTVLNQPVFSLFMFSKCPLKNRNVQLLFNSVYPFLK